MITRHRASLLLLVLGVACGDVASPRSTRTLPARVHLAGEASGSDDRGNTAECLLDLRLQLTESRREIGIAEYSGQLGGYVQRVVLDPDGNGFAFAADVAGEVTARLIGADSVEIVSPRNAGSPSPFWREQALFAGSARGAPAGTFGHGAWMCRPFMIDEGGWVDTATTVAGRWVVEPVNPSP